MIQVFSRKYYFVVCVRDMDGFGTRGRGWRSNMTNLEASTLVLLSHKQMSVVPKWKITSAFII